MKKGHVTGTRKERKPRQSTIDRYKAMGAAIQAKLATMTTEQLLGQTK
jgi:hypothetical protein